MTETKSKDKNAIKARLQILYKMFYELTDEEHQVTYDFILKYLKDGSRWDHSELF